MRSKKALYNLISSLFLQVIVIIYSFIVPKIIISNYGSDVNGLVTSITKFLSYIALFEAGFGGIVQYLLYKPIANKDKNEIDNILVASQGFFKNLSRFFIFYILVLCIVYPIIVNTSFDSLFTISLIIIIAINTFAEYYFGLIYKIYLLANQRKYVVSIIAIITYVLNIVAIVIMSHLNVSIQILKLVSTLIFVLRPICQNIYVRKRYNININIKNNHSNYKIVQKWDALIQHIASVIHGSTDVTLLTIFCKISEVSVYSVYYMVVSGIKTIVSIFLDSINSIFGDIIAKNEKENLKRKFNMIESTYHTLIVILFSVTLILITPFISIYTKNITDANYIRWTFGYLIVISELIWAIRLPYSTITLSAGHYKQTRLGAVIECVSNIVISLLLIKKYGIIGVTIGTIVAMFIRTCEFVYHSNKYILKRSMYQSIFKIILLCIEVLIYVILSKYIIFFENINYTNWILNAIIITSIISIITIIINLFFYAKDYKELINIFKNAIKKRRD